GTVVVVVGAWVVDVVGATLSPGSAVPRSVAVEHPDTSRARARIGPHTRTRTASPRNRKPPTPEGRANQQKVASVRHVLVSTAHVQCGEADDQIGVPLRFLQLNEVPRVGEGLHSAG